MKSFMTLSVLALLIFSIVIAIAKARAAAKRRAEAERKKEELNWWLFEPMEKLEKQLAEDEGEYDSYRKEAFAALEAAEASMESIMNSMAAQLKTSRGYQGE